MPGEVLILNTNWEGAKYSLRLKINTDEELDKVTETLKKHGFTFRHPEGR